MVIAAEFLLSLVTIAPHHNLAQLGHFCLFCVELCTVMCID